jgi:class 3 adenylate cyclase
MSVAVGGRIPFRVAIVTLVVGLLVVTCGGLIGYVLHRGQQSIDTLKRDYLDQVADSAVREVDGLPRTAAQLLRVQLFRFQTGQYSTADEIGLARLLAGALQADQNIQWVSYGEETGRFMGANRLGGDRIVLNISDPGQRNGVPRELRADTLAPYIRNPPLTEAYDPRTRAWYQRAVAAPGVIVWMPPYVFAEGVHGITAASAVRDADGRVRGVVTVDFTLDGIAQFLASIKLEGDGVVTLFDKDGQLLAGEPGAGQDAAARALEGWRRAGASAPSAAPRYAEIVAGGKRWDVAARSLSLGPGLDWTVAAAVPDDAFMGPIHANRRGAIAIALGGLVVAVVAGILLSARIAGALGGATAALDRIARFELETEAPPRSVLREVSQLQDAVGRVTASLRSFSRYAPEEIVRDVVVSGREAMLSGDKREVTVLFSDLRGFTAFAERTRPEDVVAILNDHFELAVGIIARHGGFVVDFLGDAVFAVFGAPRAGKDHAERAVACAIEMQRARAVRNAETRERGWPPLEMGVGIHTGTAVVGNMGSNRRIKYGVVGHVVNMAARIETFTVGGQVLVATSTRQALGDRLVVDGPRDAEGKGVGAAMSLWEVLALRGDRMLVLPSPVRDLSPLDPPLDAEVRLIFGKQLDQKVHAARLHRLGAGGAEIESDAPLGVFATLQLLLRAPTGSIDVLPLDAKVIGLSDRSGAPTAFARFSGVDWDTQDRIEALARDVASRQSRPRV